MALTTNLISYYKADGNSNDSVGSNHGTDTSITYTSGGNNGKINQGANFGGTSKIALATTIAITSQFSFSMWVNCTNVTNRQALFVKSDGASQATSSWGCEVGNTPSKLFLQIDVGSTAYSLTSATSLSNNTWYHLVFTYDGATMKIYINAVVDANTQAATGNINNITQATTYGYYGSYSGLPYTGAMDEMGIWDRALTGAEVTSLYNTGAGSQYPFATDITVSPSVETCTFTIPSYTPSVTANPTISPSVKVATFSIPTYTQISTVTVSPSVQTATFSIPSYSATADGAVTVLPSVLTSTFSLPVYTPSVTDNISLSVSVLTCTFSTPSSTTTATANITYLPTALISTFSILTYLARGDFWQDTFRQPSNTFTDKFAQPSNGWSDKY